jgi:hypothetical protein
MRQMRWECVRQRLWDQGGHTTLTRFGGRLSRWRRPGPGSPPQSLRRRRLQETQPITRNRSWLSGAYPPNRPPS